MDRDHETDVGGGRQSFPSTLWTLVLSARDDSASRRDALDRLIGLYWKPVYFFVRRRGHDVEASKDLTQGFFSTLLERDFLRDVAPRNGRFRAFILAALTHHLADERRRAVALKRGGGQGAIALDFAAAETELTGFPVDDATPENRFMKSWALETMTRALESLQEEYATSGRASEFDAYRDYLKFSDRGALTYADLAQTLGVSESDVRNKLHGLRARYRQILLDLVRGTTDNDADAQDELRALLEALS